MSLSPFNISSNVSFTSWSPYKRLTAVVNFVFRDFDTNKISALELSFIVNFPIKALTKILNFQFASRLGKYNLKGFSFNCYALKQLVLFSVFFPQHFCSHATSVLVSFSVATRKPNLYVFFYLPTNYYALSCTAKHFKEYKAISKDLSKERVRE